jgi:hypothetical protein
VMPENRLGMLQYEFFRDHAHEHEALAPRVAED